jgi:hypothetical protein
MVSRAGIKAALEINFTGSLTSDGCALKRGWCGRKGLGFDLTSCEVEVWDPDPEKGQLKASPVLLVATSDGVLRFFTFSHSQKALTQQIVAPPMEYSLPAPLPGPLARLVPPQIQRETQRSKYSVWSCLMCGIALGGCVTCEDWCMVLPRAPPIWLVSRDAPPHHCRAARHRARVVVTQAWGSVSLRIVAMLGEGQSPVQEGCSQQTLLLLSC